ncbi:MAG: hypothetical protein V4726_00915 [Verrucomicrobiota bacterium]
MFFLAQQFPASEHTVVVLNVFVVLLAIGLLLKNLLKKDVPPPPLPQPVLTKKQEEHVLRHEFEKLSREHMALAARVESVHNDVLRAGEDRAVKIHERLNLLIEGMAEVRGRSEALSEALMERDPVTRRPRPRR